MISKKRLTLLLFSCLTMTPNITHCMLLSPKNLKMVQQTQLDKKLDEIAINQGRGYKAANLTILKNISTEINTTNPAYTIAVPDFIAIPSNTIQEFISQNTQLNIATQWKNIITASFPNDETRSATLTNKQFPEGFLNECHRLEELVQKTINSIDPSALLAIGKVTQLFEKTITNEERLMVRSSGKEDTKTLANAGGNASVANVAPEAQSVLRALSTVISSYFSKKSLIQRLGAKDASLFELNPFTPVIIQRMINAKNNGLTKCGVMFTEEAEGGIAKNNTGAQTTGITVIQSAYGHNEGVVNSLIPVDTYYVTAENSVFTVIRPKISRMAPTQENGILTLEKNDANVINKPALTREVLTTLKYLATKLERAYQGPMDVEFVINEDEKAIYIVQARPLVHDQNTSKASYIINPDAITEQKITGSAIGVAGGALRYCTNADQLIIANTINQALSQYQNLNGAQKEQIQCIVVGTMAPTTSHEATAFRSENKPVLYCSDWQTIEQWLKQPNTNILISPQQGLVINFGVQITSAQQLITDQLAATGWANYPIEPYLSLMNEFNPNLSLTIENILALLPESVNKKDFIQEASKQKIPWKQLLGAIKTQSENAARVSLAALLYEIQEIIEAKSQGMKLDEDLIHKIQLLQSYLMYSAQNITQTLQFSPTHFHYSQRLFAIRFLEILLYQQPLLHEIINGYSVTTVVAKELTPEQQIIQEAKEAEISLDDASVQLMKIKNFAMNPELESEWTIFISQLAEPENTKHKKSVLFLIKQLSALNILPLWLNTAFTEKINNSHDASSATIKLMAEYLKDEKLLNQIAEKKKLLSALNIQGFADPKIFENQWKLFQETILTYFLSDEFIAEFQKVNSLGQLAALNIMSQFIDTFDLSIKAATGSTNYINVEEKVKNFHTMLKSYAALFNKWITLVREGAINYSSQGPLKSYVNIINRGVQRSNYTSNQLTLTPEFNVGGFTIGSGAGVGFLPNPPKTYEDFFTMIHQCLLVTVSALNNTNNLIQKISLPSPLNNLNMMLLNIEVQKEKVTRIGLNVLSTTLQVTYNLPLRSHSLQIITEQTKNSSEALLHLQFYGHNEDKRWNKTVAIAKIMTKDYAPVKNSTATENSCSLTLSVTDETDFSRLYKFITVIADYVTAPGKFGTNPTVLTPYSANILQNIENITDETLKNDIRKEIQPDYIPDNISVDENANYLEEARPEEPTITSNFIQRIYGSITSALQNSANWFKNLWNRFFG